MPHPIFDQFYVFEVPCNEWAFVLMNLIDHSKGVQQGDVNIVDEGRNPHYYLRRMCFEPERVAKSLGMTEKEIAKRGVIHLPLLDDDSQYPKPNVNYAGRA